MQLCELGQVSCGTEFDLARRIEVAQRVEWRVDMDFPSHSNSQVPSPNLCMFHILLFCFLNRSEQQGWTTFML